MYRRKMADKQLPENIDFQPLAWMHHMVQTISMALASLTAHIHKYTEQADWLIILATIKVFSWSFAVFPKNLQNIK